MDNLNDRLNGKQGITCQVIACEERNGGKAHFFLCMLEVTGNEVPDLVGTQFECVSFQPLEVDAQYPFDIKEVENKKTSKKGLVVTRPASTEEQRQQRAIDEEKKKAAAKAAADKEREEYEADNLKRGINAGGVTSGAPNNAANSSPAANLIAPSERAIALAGDYGYTAKQIMLMEMNGIIPPNTPHAQVAFFFETAKARGLSPITKQIYLLPFVGRSGDQWVTNYAVITGIDGMRTLADDTGQLAGIDEPLYDGLTLGQWFASGKKFPQYKAVGSGKDTRYNLESGDEPSVCTVVIKRKQNDEKCVFVGVATWGEFYPGPVGKGSQWRKMPFLMLAKCAKAQGLRDAFPKAISGIYIPEEFDRQQREVTDVAHTVVDMHKVLEDLKAIHSLDGLTRYRNDHPEYAQDAEIMEAMGIRAQELQAASVAG